MSGLTHLESEEDGITWCGESTHLVPLADIDNDDYPTCETCGDWYSRLYPVPYSELEGRALGQL